IDDALAVDEHQSAPGTDVAQVHLRLPVATAVDLIVQRAALLRELLQEVADAGGGAGVDLLPRDLEDRAEGNRICPRQRRGRAPAFTEVGTDNLGARPFLLRRGRSGKRKGGEQRPDAAAPHSNAWLHPSPLNVPGIAFSLQ